MKSRILKPIEGKSYFLFGPRGTGKTTWLKQQYPQAIYLDLLESEIFNQLLSQPSQLENLILSQNKNPTRVIIDEVQKIPELLNEVHRLIEKRKWIFILTGSSARKLKKEGVNLLAGRALHYSMFPMTSVEWGKDFSLKNALKFGMLPSILSENHPKKYLESYTKTYLKEEVLQEGLTRNLGAFARFLEAASFSQAAPLVVTNVASEAHVERKVVEDYFGILEDLMVAFRLPVFAKKAKRELLNKTKFYFFDVGIYQTLRPKGPLDSDLDLLGLAFESFLVQEIRALNHYYELGYTLYHWRTKNHVEVDLILYGEGGLKALEFKSSSRLRKQDYQGLALFLEDYPIAQATLIYGGTKRYHEAGIDVIPIQEFLDSPMKFLK